MTLRKGCLSSVFESIARPAKACLLIVCNNRDIIGNPPIVTQTPFQMKQMQCAFRFSDAANASMHINRAHDLKQCSLVSKKLVMINPVM